MGQRLNLEIWNNGKVLANAYYHWSAFTESSAEIISKALNYIENNTLEDNNALLYAVRILESTGAGLTEDEIAYANTINELKGKAFSPCVNRNYGLIAITEKGIEDIRYWEEYSAYIYIDEKRISFRILYEQKSWEYEKMQKEEYDNIVSARDLQRKEWNIDDIKFDSWKKFSEFIKTQHESWISNIKPGIVITPIE